MDEKERLKIKADAFFEVGEILRYEYEGFYDQEGIEDFFDSKARELVLKAGDTAN